MRLEGLFGLYHVIYLIIFVIILSIIFYVFYNKLKDEKKRTIGIKILSICWLITAIIHQIATTYNSVVVFQLEGYTWATLLPYTYCSFLSFATPIALLIFKKDNIALHCLTYFCFFGGCSSFFAPWLNNPKLAFFSLEIMTALIHHSFMFGMSVLLLVIKYVQPTMRRFYAYPVGVGLIVLFGVFEKYALHFPVGMMVGEPLYDKLPNLTSWWGLWLAGSFLVLVFIFIYETVVNKKTVRQTFDVHNMFDTTIFQKKKKKDKDVKH